MKRSKFLKQASYATLGCLTFPDIANAFTLEKVSKDIIIGHNSHRYKVDLNWGQLNALKTPVNDCHEMVQDSKGRIVLLTNHVKNNVIIYNKSGKLLETWGTKYPGAHGLSLVQENGPDFLLITDYERHQIIKTTSIVAGIGILILIFGGIYRGLGTVMIFTALMLWAYRFFLRKWANNFQTKSIVKLENWYERMLSGALSKKRPYILSIGTFLLLIAYSKNFNENPSLGLIT